MSAGRRCRRCGAREVHRARRQEWQRRIAWVVPLRPQQCLQCSAGSWGPLHADEGRRHYVVAAAFWLLILVAAVWPRGRGHVEAPNERASRNEAASAAVSTSEPPEPAPTVAATPPADPVVAEPLPTGVLADVPVDDRPPVEARQRAMRLDAIDVRWTGEDMEVVVRGGDGVLFHAFRFDANVQGYVLDLPGRWTMPNGLRMTRSFERSNLLRLRVGRHRDFLRIVFSLRDPAGAEPQVEQRDGELRLLIR